MPRDYKASERTAVPVPQGVLLTTSLVVFLSTSTASIQSATVFDKTSPVKVPTMPTVAPTAADRPVSALQYSVATGDQKLSAAAGSVSPLTGMSVDRKELLGERIRSILMEPVTAPDRVRPSRDAVTEALRFVDLLPVDSPALHVSVADDGEVNFFRRAPGLFIDVGLFGDGQIHFYARVDALGIDVDGSEPFSGRSLPRDLVIPITTD